MNELTGLYDELKDAAAENGSGRITLAEFVRPFVQRDEQVTVSGHGTSMLPTICDHDRLVMAPLCGEIRAGDVLLYTQPDGHSVIHRVWRVHGEYLDMLGDHQLIVERGVPKAAVIARVQTIIHADGRTSKGHRSILRSRVQYGIRFARLLLCAVGNRIKRRRRGTDR